MHYKIAMPKLLQLTHGEAFELLLLPGACSCTLTTEDLVLGEHCKPDRWKYESMRQCLGLVGDGSFIERVSTAIVCRPLALAVDKILQSATRVFSIGEHEDRVAIGHKLRDSLAELRQRGMEARLRAGGDIDKICSARRMKVRMKDTPRCVDLRHQSLCAGILDQPGDTLRLLQKENRARTEVIEQRRCQLVDILGVEKAGHQIDTIHITHRALR